MKTRRIVIFLLAMVVIFSSCDRGSEKRKIKLSSEQVTDNTNQQLSTTIHLAPKQRRSIAVLFFQNLTGDQNLQWLQKGLTEMFIRTLSQSRYLSILSTDRLTEILNQVRTSHSSQDINMDMAAIVAQEANVEAILVGNIVKRGNILKINVKLKEPTQGTIIKEESIEGPGLEKILNMVDELTQRIKSDLLLALDKSEESKSIGELTTNSVEAWRHYTNGVELMNKFLHQDAIAEFKKAISLDSTFVSAYLYLLNEYGADGKINEALYIYDKIKSLRDKATERELYKIDLIEARIKSDIRAMMAIHEKWLKKYPEDVEASYVLAGLYGNLNNHAKAIEYLNRVLSIDPKYKLAVNQLGYSYAYIGDFKNALAALNHYKELAKGEPNPYDSIGEIYFMMGDFRNAEKYFKRALKINENFNVSYLHLAEVYLDIGKYKKALKTLDKYLNTVTEGYLRANAYSYIALTNRRIKRDDEAILNFEKSLQIHPYQPWVITLLSQIYADKGDTTKAQQILNQHYELIKKELTTQILQESYFHSLVFLSLWHDIHTEDTIDFLSKILGNNDNPSFQIRVKFMLSLLYIKNHQFEKLDTLWQDEPSPNVIEYFKEVRNISFSDFWKYYAFFNDLFYYDKEVGVQHYQNLINYASVNEAKQFAVGFRLLLSDLYYHCGDNGSRLQQLKIIGMPAEEKWLIIGPFDNKNGFRKRYPPEKKIDITRTYRDRDRTLVWQHPEDGKKDGFIYFNKIYDKSHWTVAYGVIYIDSPSDKKVQFRIGGDDAVKMWLNDKQVWKYNKHRSGVIDDDIINVNLQRGLNQVLIKVVNRWRDWGFYFRVTDEIGNGVTDIQFIAADEVK